MQGHQVIEGLISGKLHGFAETRKGKNDSSYAVAKVLAAPHDGEPLFVNVIAFVPDACAALMALSDGDAVAIAGSLTPKVWTDKQGNTKPALDMIAQQVMTVYHAGAKGLAMSEVQG